MMWRHMLYIYIQIVYEWRGPRKCALSLDMYMKYSGVKKAHCGPLHRAFSHQAALCAKAVALHVAYYSSVGYRALAS